MKKLILLVSVCLIAFGCSKESNESESTLDSTYDLQRGHKVDVCHQRGNGNWHVINVSQNALPAHLAHGDVLLEDNDGDGFVAELNECVPGGDCDDNEPTTYPGAEEICGDGVDNNCDGQIDEDCCPCFSLDEILANDNLSYFDTSTGSPCRTDGVGFDEPGCAYGISFARFICVAPDTGCAVVSGLTAQEKTSCQQIVYQAIAILALPETCSGMLTNETKVEGPFGEDGSK
jgi:hypothetical protein